MSLPPFPPSVNRTEFQILFGQGKFHKAAELLPEGLRQTFLNFIFNSTGPQPPTDVNNTETVVNVTFINETIVSGANPFEGEVTLIKAYAIVLLITSILGILGNSLVITIYARRFKDLNICKMLILHLAISDLFFSVIQIPSAVPSVHAKDWPYGEMACKIMRFFLLVGGLVAAGTIFVIAVERYLGIMHSMKFSRGGLRVVLSMLMVWIFALASAVPVAIALKFDVKKNDCEENWTKDGLTKNGRTAYDFFLLIFWFIFPMCVIGFAYASIINMLRKPLHKRGFKSESNAEFVIKRQKEDLKVVRTLIVVVVVFFVCCLPIRIMWIVLDFVDTSKMSQSSYYALLYTGQIPYPIHVAANPLIYSTVDKKFRADVKSMLNVRATLRRLQTTTFTASTTLANKGKISGTKSDCQLKEKSSTDTGHKFIHSSQSSVDTKV